MKYRVYQCNISYSSQFITQCPLHKAKSVNESKHWRAACQPHACELPSPSVIVWLWGEGLRTFAPWSRLACFCTCTVFGLVPSTDRRRLGVSDLERVLCRSSVDRSVVCRMLVLRLSSFFSSLCHPSFPPSVVFLWPVGSFPSPPFHFPPVRAPRESVSLFFSFEFKTAFTISSVVPCLFALSAHYLTGAYRDVMSLSQTA